MDKVEVSLNETLEQSRSTTPTLDQQSIAPIEQPAALSEKPDLHDVAVVEDDESPEDAIKRKKKEKIARILIFVGLQLALFLAALDG